VLHGEEANEEELLFDVDSSVEILTAEDGTDD
jgi:hypothetical protein